MKVKAVSKCMAIPAQNPPESWCEACGTAAVPPLHWWEGSNLTMFNHIQKEKFKYFLLAWKSIPEDTSIATAINDPVQVASSSHNGQTLLAW